MLTGRKTWDACGGAKKMAWKFHCTYKLITKKR